jgi:hypothetical protein
LDFRYGKRTKIDFHKNFHRTRTTLEANAAMRSIVRRDTGASYEEFREAIVFLSNLLAFGATTIRGHLQGSLGNELFFKALKQTLIIKTFVGTSANAVRTQVWTASIAMLVLKYLQLKSTFSWLLSTLAALLRQQLFFYRDLWVWLDDPFQAPPALAGVHDDSQQLEIMW